MLVLSRLAGEQIKIGDSITITLCGIKGCRARIGIDAPVGVKVLRAELPDAVKLLEKREGRGAKGQEKEGRRIENGADPN